MRLTCATGPACPTSTCPASGFHAALGAAQRFRAGDLPGAESALAEALSADGPSAPLLLMQAVLKGLAGDEEQAAGTLRAGTGPLGRDTRRGPRPGLAGERGRAMCRRCLSRAPSSPWSSSARQRTGPAERSAMISPHPA